MMAGYIRLPDDLIAPPPYAAGKSQMHLMFLDGKQDVQQAFCEAALNRSSGGACRFTVVTGKVLFALLYSTTMRSADPNYSHFGYTQEVDIGFWTLVHGGLVADRGSWRHYWMPSYLFVDSASAQAAGRENYGYPKSVATITRASGALTDVRVTVDTQHFPVYAPDQPLVVERLIDVAAPAAPQDDTAKSPASLDGLRATVVEQLSVEGIANLPGVALPYFDIPQIMLRQVRDATRPSQTLLREILVATPRITAQPNVKILPHGAAIRLRPSASHDIAGVHGLDAESGSTPVICLEADYTVGPATRLWPR
jgi:hypothetical protein